MKVKVSDYIADFMVLHGVTNVFTVTGGGAMHLNDSLGHHKKLHCIYNHHEQASAIAAEAYCRYSGKLPLVCVTSGPGGTNAITGVLGGWLDSIPMFIISGQVKRETTVYSTSIKLRQLGDQEYNIIESVKPITKYAVIVLDPNEIRYHLEKALFLCSNKRGGPVWIDIPLDVQSSIVETDDLVGFETIENKANNNYSNEIINKINESKRPVIIAGSAIRLSKSYDLFLELVDKMKIPVLTAWNSHDLLPDDNLYYCGRPGTVGTRGGNFITEKCDLLIILGSRMNIRQIGYNYKTYAENSYKIMVDIDESELNKPTLSIDFPICADVKDVISDLLENDLKIDNKSEWLAWCKDINERYPAVLPEYYQTKELNPYVFIKNLFEKLNENECIVCGNGSACVITFQAALIKKGQRLFTNSGCAAMGYGFPASIGCAVANSPKRVICIDGDGSLMMNIQELQTAVSNKMNIKLVIINNNGYHSIRQTQSDKFSPPLVGVDSNSGITFPDFEKVSKAFGIDYFRTDSYDNMNENINCFLGSSKLALLEVFVDTNQNFEPKVSSKVLHDGTIISPKIDDMFPFLDRDEYDNI